MEVLSPSSEKLKTLHRPILTVGSFDGLHLAHQTIIHEVIRRARQGRNDSLVVTFDPHPQSVIDPGTAPDLLTTLEEKLGILESQKLDFVLVLPFTTRLARWPASRFVGELLHKKLGVHEMVIGHDHAFGHERKGRLNILCDLGRKYDFRITAIEPVLFEGKPISSTRIRQCLLAGRVDHGAEMLGRAYSLEGTVIAGEGRGRRLQYPTANLKIAPRKLVPANGVYAVRSRHSSRSLNGLLNIGLRPTFGGTERTLEIHFFDFKGSLYRERIRVELVNKIRDECRFADGQELMNQIRRDEQMARRLLA